MTKDELWEKYSALEGCGGLIDYDYFLAALTEYGNAVKAEAVKVLEDDWFAAAESDCGGAIKGMKLP